MKVIKQYEMMQAISKLYPRVSVGEASDYLNGKKKLIVQKHDLKILAAATKPKLQALV